MRQDFEYTKKEVKRGLAKITNSPIPIYNYRRLQLISYLLILLIIELAVVIGILILTN